MLFTLVLSTQYAALQISTLSLHDALPISLQAGNRLQPAVRQSVRRTQVDNAEQRGAVGQPDDARRLESPCVVRLANGTRSEEHTSELQSRRDLVCRLLLEKKKIAATKQLS